MVFVMVGMPSLPTEAELVFLWEMTAVMQMNQLEMQAAQEMEALILVRLQMQALLFALLVQRART